VTTTFPHHELLQHRWKGKLVIDVERCVDHVMRKVDRGGGDVWSHPLFRLPAVLQAVAPGTYDRSSSDRGLRGSATRAAGPGS